MKKTLKITGITLLSLLLILSVLPFFFQGKIESKAKAEINKMLNAKVDFEDFSLSFIRNFPHASITVKNFSIIGVEEFENDTLIVLDRFRLVIDIKSLWGEQIEINRINVNHPRILAKVLADGKANWDIMKPSEETEEDTTATSFKLQLQKLTLENAFIVYDDAESNMKAILNNVSFLLTGDMTQDVTNLKTITDVESLSFIMDKVTYINQAKAEAKVDLAADFNQFKFTFSDNEFLLNQVKANFEGFVTLLDDGFDMDIKLNAPKTEFKDLLSLIPAIYAKDFESIETKGEISLDAMVKGLFTDSLMPAFDVKMDVSNAYFKYPDLPKSVNNINISAQVNSPGGDLDLTKVNISKFHFEIDRNPFDFYLKLSNPISDPMVDAGAKGVLNLNLVKEVYPLEDGMDIAGIINANMSFGGRLSFLEKEEYEKFKADGTLALTAFRFIMPDFVPVTIAAAEMSFTPKYLQLSKLDMKLGENDFQANGNLENFMAYALRDETLKGELNLQSNFINVNDFLSETVDTTTVEEPLSVIEIPKNIDFRLNGNLKKVTYDNIILENIKGIILVKDGTASVQNAQMNAFGGQMGMDAIYNSQNLQTPQIEMDLKIKDVLYTEAYKQADMVKQLAPIFEKMTGKFSSDFSFKSILGQDMMPIYNSISGGGTLVSKNITVSDVKVLDGLALVLKNNNLKTIKADDIKVLFAIKDGKIMTQPFDVKLANTNMNLSGSTGLDQTIDYVAKIQMPQSISNIPVKMDVKIGGTFTKPTFKVGATETLFAAKETVKKEIKEKATEGVNKLVEEAYKKKESLVAEAKKQGDKLRYEAKIAGEKLVKEAEYNSKKMQDEAKNPLAKVAAQKSGELLVKEAKKKAADLERKADQEALKFENTANKKGDEFIQAAEQKAKSKI